MNSKLAGLIKTSEWTIYLVVSIIMVSGFCICYGVQVINPAYIDWMLEEGLDLPCHYLGWKAYRTGRWMFPIGCTDYLSYPYKMSVIFTDSIPCLAVFFKILSPILPADFQYFGLWGVLCYILQGILSTKIMRHFTKEKILLILSSIFFAFIPIVIWRLFPHTALGGQWLILLALETIFAFKSYHKNKKIYFMWFLIAILASSTHIYFILICGIVLIGYCSADITAFKRCKRSICLLLTYVISCSITVYLLGGFTAGVVKEQDGLGRFSLNLNAFINPLGYSSILKELPVYCFEQKEGFAYLGGGCILLFITNMLKVLIGRNKCAVLLHYNYEILALLVTSAVAFIVALSPTIAIGNRVVFEYKLPEIIVKCWSMFRVSGRMAWIIVYIIMLISCVSAIKFFQKKSAAVLLFICAIIQVYDIHAAIIAKNHVYATHINYESKVTDEKFWDWLGDNDEIKHIVFVESISGAELYDITNWALNHKKTVNQFYFARSLDERVSINIQKTLSEPNDSEIFLFYKDSIIECMKYNLNYYKVGEYIVGYTGICEYAETITKNNLEYIQTYKDNIWLSGGEDTDSGIRYLYPGGLSFGPYLNIPSGDYKVTLEGKNLDQAELLIYSKQGAVLYEFDAIKRESDKVILSVQFQENVEGLEIVVRNNTEDTIELKKIRLGVI